jgi:hypothetical protein
MVLKKWSNKTDSIKLSLIGIRFRRDPTLGFWGGGPKHDTELNNTDDADGVLLNVDLMEIRIAIASVRGCYSAKWS